MQFAYTIMSPMIGITAIDAVELSIIERFRQKKAMLPMHPAIGEVEARPTIMHLISGTIMVNPWLKRSVIERWKGASEVSRSQAYDDDRALMMTREMLSEGVTCFTTTNTDYRYLTIKKAVLHEEERFRDTIPYAAFIEAEEHFPFHVSDDRCLHVTPLQCSETGPHDPLTCIMNRPFLLLIGHRQTVSLDVVEQRGDLLYDDEVIDLGVTAIRRLLHRNEKGE